MISSTAVDQANTKPFLRTVSLGPSKSAIFGMPRYWNTLCFMVTVTGVSFVLEPLVGYRSVGFIFLIGVLFVGMFGTLGSVLFAAAFSALSWDFLFIPPRFNLSILSADDILLCSCYFVVAVITGSLTNRIRQDEKLMRDREERTDVLYQVLKDISDSPDKKEIIRRVTERVGKLLGAQCHVVLRQKDGALDFPALQKLSMPIDEGLYLPLRGLNEDVGVFAFIPEPSNEKLSPEHLALLKSIVGQLGISLERHLLRQRLIEAQRLKDSETLHQTLLNSISHEMRTPLTTILSAAEALNDQAAEMGAFRELSKSLNEAGDRLNHVIENLLDMSRLSSGILALQLDWQDLNDLVGVVLAKNSKMILHHSVQVQLGTEVDLIRIDFRLFEHALSNLVLNAVQYTPAQSEIRIIARRDHHNIRIAIVDNGPGIPVASAPYIFDKFFRVAGSPPGGTGLGLSIVKSIVELHGGSIAYEPQVPHGAGFVILLPFERPPQIPIEEST